MGYLQCEECGNIYKLKNNESPDDFSDKCNCGGKFIYTPNPNQVKETKNSLLEGDEPIKTCPHCNLDNNPQAQFCKKCAKKLNLNFINRFNRDLNLFAVFMGLGVSCIVLIISSLIFGYIIATTTLDLMIYVAVVLMFMTFFGGISTGIVGCDDAKEGARNGIFLSLIAMVILGLVVGAILFITIGIAATISQSLQPYYSTMSSSSLTTTTSSSSVFDSLELAINITKWIITMVLVFISGAVGGSFGVFLKKGLKDL